MPKIKLKSTLPDKPSELILVALKDMIKCERSRNYKVYMDVWHELILGSCAVCLGGSVIAQTLGANLHENLTPNFMPHLRVSDVRKLMALDKFRQGNVWTGLTIMRLRRKMPKMDGYIKVSDYHSNPSQFKKDMRAMAKYLKEKGL